MDKVVLGDPVEDRGHRYLIYADGDSPHLPTVRELGAYIVGRWGDKVLSTSRFRKLPHVALPSAAGANAKPVLVRPEALLELIARSRSARLGELRAEDPECRWLDARGLRLARTFHTLADHKEAMAMLLLTPFGEGFPVKPTLDREGVAWASFQIPLQENINSLRASVVDRSHHAVTSDAVWLNTLRMLVNDCVSVVDVTLHQLYFAAEFGLFPKWQFDRDKLGERHGVKLTDKLHWIGRITGRPLDNARDEVAAFIQLKDLRNHFNHFDPPCLVISIEDVAAWLNLVPFVGRLLWKIRDKLEAQLTPEIVEMILAPRVVISPHAPERHRTPQLANAGYRSSTWPPASQKP